MKCERCNNGRVFLDRVFTDNMSFETSCLHCGDRKYIPKNSRLGKILAKRESILSGLENGIYIKR